MLETDLQPTDSHQYLLNSNCHPGHEKRSISFSKALGFKRICSNESTARQRCDELVSHLTRRGYNKNKVKKEINRALERDETDETARVRSDKMERVPLVTTYHPGLPNNTGILDRYHPIPNQSELMRKAVPNTPFLSFRQPHNLRKLLVTAELKSPSDSVPRSACQPCGNKRCALCDIMITEPSIRSTTNGKYFRLKSNGDTCKSEFTVITVVTFYFLVIYLPWFC